MRTRLAAWTLLAAPALGLAAWRACREAPPPPAESMAPHSSWDVYKGERKVLRIKDEPGPLMSTALLPPGAKPATHPFLTAAALDPGEEGALRRHLEAASDFADFVARLRKAGYAVKPSEQ